jgi:hypothetical protein
VATQTRVPTGDGTNTNWFPNTGTRVDAVDDAVGTPDDDTTYLEQTASGQRCSFTFSPFTVPAGATINSVQIIGRLKYVGTSSDVRLNVYNESAVNEDTDRTLTSSYANYTRTMTVNPFTGVAWTVDQVNTEPSTANRLVQIEVRSIAPNTDIRCTSLYVLVDYTEAAGTSGVARLTLLGVG